MIPAELVAVLTAAQPVLGAALLAGLLTLLTMAVAGDL
jgi:hypothetical protein